MRKNECPRLGPGIWGAPVPAHAKKEKAGNATAEELALLCALPAGQPCSTRPGGEDAALSCSSLAIARRFQLSGLSARQLSRAPNSLMKSNSLEVFNFAYASFCASTISPTFAVVYLQGCLPALCCKHVFTGQKQSMKITKNVCITKIFSSTVNAMNERGKKRQFERSRSRSAGPAVPRPLAVAPAGQRAQLRTESPSTAPATGSREPWGHDSLGDTALGGFQST